MTLVLLTILLSSSFLHVFSDTVHHEFSPQHKHHIVYMGHKKDLESEVIINSNHEMLASYMGSHEHAKRRFVHHYHKSFRGFSAMLTPEEAKQLREHDSVVSVWESKVYTLQTTRSYDFIMEQVQNNGPNNGTFEYLRNNPLNEVVIGHFDSGVWPESASFNPSSFGPSPKYFCEWGNDDSGLNGCTNKIIGARYYSKGYSHTFGGLRDVFSSARDDYGHGTHTISTAAGVDVPFYNENGEILKVQKGGAPRARIAIYKVCWHNLCDEGDVLSAFDDAIVDGVHLITMSLCSFHITNIFQDGFSIGSFHSYKNGILTVAAAGNEGEKGPGSVVNGSPWALTVAATSTDRVHSSEVVLGNGKTLKGFGLISSDLINQEITWANERITGKSNCFPNQLEWGLIQGKIVVCHFEGVNYKEKLENVLNAGGIGALFVDDMEGGRIVTDYDVANPIIGRNDYQILKEYINFDNGPKTVTILRSKIIFHATPAPQMAAFSSRGPNRMIPEIIKPDIAAPGISILASIPRSPPPPPHTVMIVYPNDKINEYMSGTSMATPHVAGIAAVLKSTYPNWRPAWIKSAIMTTATWQDNTNGHIRFGNSYASPFEMGSGLVVPDRVFAPGLVYDMDDDDIFAFLCSQAYSIYDSFDAMYRLAKMYEPHRRQNEHPVLMACRPRPFPARNLNYPSIAINGLRGRVTVKRTLTLATTEGSPCVYRPIVELPKSIGYFVQPAILDFRRSSVLDYHITFENINADSTVYGKIIWTDDHGHDVRSPIVLII